MKLELKYQIDVDGNWFIIYRDGGSVKAIKVADDESNYVEVKQAAETEFKKYSERMKNLKHETILSEEI